MKIGYVLLNFPALSETFIRREVLALCEAGHRVFVYTAYNYSDALVPESNEPNLVIRQVPFLRNIQTLIGAIHADGIEHLHSSLMMNAQRAAHSAARSLQLSFTITAYSGHDVFTARDPQLYRDISADPLCEAIVVEDPFMRDWLINRLGAREDKVTIIPNSFDLDVYRLSEPRPPRDRVVVLAIARFVEKKGLLNLVHAFNKLCTMRDDAELWVVGRGPEESRLRRAAGRNARIKFPGAMTEEQTRDAYVEADIFCLPCIQTASRDADGVPTTVLEAMAFELPVVGTNLLSTPFYVRDGKEGLLVAPGDIGALVDALERLCADAELRDELGRAGRERVAELCDLRRNIETLENIMVDARWRRWRYMLDELQKRRKSYTPQIENYYIECRVRAVEYFKPSGRLLDIGCGEGKMRHHMPDAVEYYGCDPVPTDPPQQGFNFVRARGEALPYANEFFDSVLLNCVLINVFDTSAVLAEAARVLKPGGKLFIRECVNDANPIHLNHFSVANLRNVVAENFSAIESQTDGAQMILLKAAKVGDARVESKSKLKTIAKNTPATSDGKPLVSIAITSHNREKFIRTCIDSVLNQTYRPLEVVVVDDGSTDSTRRILEQYHGRIRVAHNEQNRGIAHAKNRALTMTSEDARYVGLLDSDDYFHPRFVERCVGYLEEHRGIGLVYTDDTLVDVGGRELQRQRAIEPWSIDAWLRSCNLRGDTWLARRELVMQTALHDESLSHDVDYDLFYQLLEITTFAHLPEFLAFIRQHDGRTTRNRLGLAKCHAANLVKYGYSPEYAYLRARRNPEWTPAIEEGIALGHRLRALRHKHADGNAANKNSDGDANGNGNGNGHHPPNGNGQPATVEQPIVKIGIEESGALAIDGGTPVRSAFLPFGTPCLDADEIEEVVDTLRSGWIGTGPKVEKFERQFAEYVGAKHAVALNSCTAGLFLSLTALGIGAGDEVITTPFTFAATANVIEHVGARPRFADINPQTLNLDPEEVERAITPRTKAIIPVHFGGLSCDMDALLSVAAKHGLTVIEDAAHAIGTRYRGRMVGTLGTLASFSFYANKNLTTAEGGMVTTDDPALAATIRRLRLHGLDGDAWKRFNNRRLINADIMTPGYKYNMPDLAASLGIHQLRKQERFLQTRERYARMYDEAFADLPVRLQVRPRNGDDHGDRHSLHLYVLVLEENRWRVPRDEVVEALLQENVGAAVHYRAIHTHPFYREKYDYRPEDFPHAHKIGERILSLPLTPGMTDVDIVDVLNAVYKVAKAYAE